MVLMLLAFAFFLPISISLAQPFAYAALPVWIYVLRKGDMPRPWQSPFFWPVTLFAALMILAALMGPRPEFSLPRSRRILLFPVIFMIGGLFTPSAPDPRRTLVAPLLMFVFGATILGAWDLIRVPLEWQRGVQWYDVGNMRDPQLYLVGACIIMALWVYRPVKWPTFWLTAIILINVTGIVLHFKRGVWVSFVITAVIVAALTRRYRILLALAAGIVVLFFIPQTRDRLDLLHEELQEGTGGRRVLWTRVAPDMIKDHPWGAGFRALDYPDFKAYSPMYIQPGLNHLHNNILQLAVDAGWLGCAVWVVWMTLTLVIMVRLGRQFHLRNDRERVAVALATLSAFSGLMVNGMVEYNFGNSVIFMVFLFLIGLTDALYRSARPAEGSAP